MENNENNIPVQPEEPVFTPPVQQNVYAPVQQPVFTAPEQPVFASEQPAYTEQPVYTEQPAYIEQPVYTEPPVCTEPPKQEKKKKERKDAAGWKAALCIVLVVGLVFSTAWILGSHYNKQLADMQTSYDARIAGLEQSISALQNRPAGTVTTPSGTTQLPSVQQPSGDMLTPAQVYQQNLPSVVMIKNVIRGGYFSSSSIGTGSGFIVSTDGFVVTNYHVVEGGGTLSVVLYDGQEFAATLVGYDSANDVALLKADAEGLQPAVLGDSDELVVGDQVAAIGNPLGELTSTMTVGYVSAKERDVNTSGFAINMIQTDAAINSGNSGGPLFNMYGQVVGITSAKYSGSSSSGATIEGIGFAIPLNDVLPLLVDLMTNGRDTGPYLGISVKDVDSDSASYYGLPTGAYVSEVIADSCAQKAGVMVKDIIIAVGDHTVGSVNDLSRALRNYKAGDTVELTVSRGGQQVTLTVTLDEKPVQIQQEDTQQTPAQGDWSQMFPEGEDWSQFIPGFGG